MRIHIHPYIYTRALAYTYNKNIHCFGTIANRGLNKVPRYFEKLDESNDDKWTEGDKNFFSIQIYSNIKKIGE